MSEVNLIKSLARTVDDIVDNLVGGRPASKIVDLLEDVAPANLVRRAGLPAPGDLVENAAQQAERLANRLPRLPFRR